MMLGVSGVGKVVNLDESIITCWCSLVVSVGVVVTLAEPECWSGPLGCETVSAHMLVDMKSPLEW